MATRVVSKTINLDAPIEEVSKYITAIDQNGIKVHAENNSNLNYVKINAEGMEIHQNVSDTDNIVASFGASGSRIGEENGMHISVDADSIDFYSQLTDLIGYINGLKAFFSAIEATSSLYVGEKYVVRKTPSGSLGVYLR